jgi:hypothetical protein
VLQPSHGLAKEIIEIRSSSTARLACIVRLVRLSQGSKGQELLVVYYPSRIVRSAYCFTVYCFMFAFAAEWLFLLCLDLSVLEQTA